MPLSVNGTASALLAFGTKQAISANNLANSSTRHFQKSDAILEQGANDTVRVTSQRVASPPAQVLNGDGTSEDLSNVDVAAELVDMTVTQTAYAANVKVLQSEDEMQRTSLDLIG